MDRYQDWFQQVSREVDQVRDLKSLQDLRTRWLGKNGRIADAMKELKTLGSEEKRQLGQILNALRQEITDHIESTRVRLEEDREKAQLEAERLDMTLPGRVPRVGMLHPMTRVRRLIEDVLLRMGFSLQYGPQVESVWYNFEALNMPEDHPARDMQDSFFVDVPKMVLRTHTSPVQIRSMERLEGRLPVKVLAPGVVYRRDDDATHVPMFQQVEGLVVDTSITLADLKGTLSTMARELLGSHIKTRFRPSYFPFTEPSMEMDVSCAVCDGAGCRTCKGTGWVEILGSGMVHPTVLKNGGYDPDRVTGFAFGLGIERVTMRLFGLDDLRLLYQNDLRYLQEFEGAFGRVPL